MTTIAIYPGEAMDADAVSSFSSLPRWWQFGTSGLGNRHAITDNTPAAPCEQRRFKSNYETMIGQTDALQTLTYTHTMIFSKSHLSPSSLCTLQNEKIVRWKDAMIARLRAKNTAGNT
jgi:hypothetical protein